MRFPKIFALTCSDLSNHESILVDSGSIVHWGTLKVPPWGLLRDSLGILGTTWGLFLGNSGLLGNNFGTTSGLLLDNCGSTWDMRTKCGLLQDYLETTLRLLGNISSQFSQLFNRYGTFFLWYVVNPHVQTVQNIYGKGGWKVLFREEKNALGGVAKNTTAAILNLEQNPPERKFLTYIKIFSQEDLALKSKLRPWYFLLHLPIFAGNSRFTGISQLRAGKTRSKRPRSH